MVFFYDAVLGVHDTLYVTERGWRHEITFEKDSPGYMGVEHGWSLYFTYKISNNGFSRVRVELKVSLFVGERRILTLLSTNRSAGPFQTIEVEWSLDTEELDPGKDYVLKIETNYFQRSLYLTVYRAPAVDEYLLQASLNR